MLLLEINIVHKHKYSATTTTTTSTMNERAPLVPLSASIAQRAFESADVEASKAYHQTKQEEEPHQAERGLLKPVIFGGLDGLLTSFAIVLILTNFSKETQSQR